MLLTFILNGWRWATGKLSRWASTMTPASISRRRRARISAWWQTWRPSACRSRVAQWDTTYARPKWQTFAVTFGLLAAGLPAAAGAQSLGGGRASNHDEMWLPAWRWAGRIKLDSDYGTVTDALNPDRLFQFGAQICFMITNFLWQVMLVLISKAASLNLVTDLSGWINELYAKVAGVLITVDGGRGGLIWLVAVIAIIAALWKVIVGRKQGAFRMLMKTFIPLALLMYISAQSFQSAQLSASLTKTFEQSGFFAGDNTRVNVNTVGSAGWLAETGMTFTDGLLGHIPSALGMTGVSTVSNPYGDVNQGAYSSRCKRYLDELHRRYQDEVNTRSNVDPTNTSPGAFGAQSALMEVTSGMWETTVFQSWARAQFGATEMSLEGACLKAERDNQVRPSDQIEVWNAAVPELGVNAEDVPGSIAGGSQAAAGWFFTGDDANRMEATSTFMAWCQKTGGAADSSPQFWKETPQWSNVWERGRPEAMPDGVQAETVFDPTGDFAGSSPLGACQKFWYLGDQTPGDGVGFPGIDVLKTAKGVAAECAAAGADAGAAAADSTSTMIESFGHFAVSLNPIYSLTGVGDFADQIIDGASASVEELMAVADPRAFAASVRAGGECLKDNPAFNWSVYFAAAQDTGPFLFVQQGAVDAATSANGVDSVEAREFLNGMNGKSTTDMWLVSLMALITTAILVFGLGGMALGMVFVQLEALLGWIFLPFALLAMILPGDWGNQLAKRVFKMLLAAMFAKTIYALGFTVLLTLINLLYKIGGNVTTADSFLAILYSGFVPLLAIFGLRKFAQKIGLSSFTSFRGALKMPGQVMSGTAPGLDRIQQNRGSDGSSGIRRGAGTALAAGTGAAGAQGGNQAMHLLNSRKDPDAAAKSARPPIAGGAGQGSSAAQGAAKGGTAPLGVGAGSGDPSAAAIGALGVAGGASGGGLPGGSELAAGGAPALGSGLPGSGAPGAGGAPPMLGTGTPTAATAGAPEVGAAKADPAVKQAGMSAGVGMTPSVQAAVDQRSAGTERGRDALSSGQQRAETAKDRPEMTAAMHDIDAASPAITAVSRPPTPITGNADVINERGEVIAPSNYEDTADRATAHVESMQDAAVSAEGPVQVSDATHTALSREEPKRATTAPRPPRPPSSEPAGGFAGSAAPAAGGMDNAIANSTAGIGAPGAPGMG